MKECKVFLKPKKEESLLRFHPWVFSGAIQTIEGEPEEGDLVEVYGTNGRFLGHVRAAGAAYCPRKIRIVYQAKLLRRLLPAVPIHPFRVEQQTIHIKNCALFHDVFLISVMSYAV